MSMHATTWPPRITPILLAASALLETCFHARFTRPSVSTALVQQYLFAGTSTAGRPATVRWLPLTLQQRRQRRLARALPLPSRPRRTPTRAA